MNKIYPPSPQMLPSDGRFGAGPSRIRQEQVDALYAATELGTSHRKPAVKSRVHSIREGLSELFTLPSGYEIAIGNGGATAFWSVAAASLVRERAKCAVFGEFGKKCASDWAAAPWLQVVVNEAPPGELSAVRDDIAQADVYAYPQNETSTGVASGLYRGAPGDALTVVDATSIAGASTVDWDLVDTYYFSPQKCLGSEGGLWLSILSPAAAQRAEELSANKAGRFMPSFLNLASALKQSRLDQTLNTPAIATLILLDEQIKWLLDQGGLAAAQDKAAAGAKLIADWAEKRPWAQMFVKDPEERSIVTSTVDLAPEVPAAEVASVLREVGILDIEGYRGLGRNQLRIASFPSVETADIGALLECIDWVAGQMVGD
ncbi:phosphoserine transaminase [Actinomycetaceae bacterium MB13-C1-2]|nr:phosphoserine transaminase [Actinomycetaceae bacterium MB13-C1-2]